jgi:hypothetical protein
MTADASGPGSRFIALAILAVGDSPRERRASAF